MRLLQPCLLVAGLLSPLGATDELPRPAPDPPGSFSFRAFWQEHRWHILTVFAAEQVEYHYRNEVGASVTPLLFEGVPGLDRSVRDWLSVESGSRGFLSAHKTNIFRAVAIGSILAVNRSDWQAAGDDAMGLIEALKFNTATTSLMKMVVGRRRPALDLADPDAIGQPAWDAIQSHGGGRASFYSQATSQAFTFASYLDLMAARRLRQRPVARAFSAAGLYGLAAGIGYTRIREGQHYLTDVLAGAGAGTLVGRGFYRANHKEEPGDGVQERGERRFRFSPPMPAPGGGLMVWAAMDS